MDIRAVLFDMDGTLLPMDQAVFTKSYFKELGKVLCPYGVEPDKFTAAVWAGTKDMIKNDGSRCNADAFWEKFCNLTGFAEDFARPICDNFYVTDFKKTKEFTSYNPLAVEAVKAVKEKGLRTALATNPLFPMSAQLVRLEWTGLKGENFEFVTSYETESYCKPNPEYYRAVCKKLGLAPEECLMIGNDVEEDMIAASSAGMKCWLLTDCVVESENHVWDGPKGNFAETVEMIKSL
ncbi:MAG: HAD family hydrolase [Oscillospiraceae bacterium]|nr:HAD family hydrolase [Oscillospiraceae bacterium]